MIVRDILTRTQTFNSLLAGFLVLFPLATFAVPTVDPSDQAFQQAVEHVVEQYLLSHPEIIELTLQAMGAKHQVEKREHVRKLIATKQEDLLNDPDSPMSGSLSGDVTVVEFFDYRCGYCRRAAGAVTQLQKDDPNVRIVYKDFPILGEASLFAARAALASRSQGKHVAFHEALLAAKNELTPKSILVIAARAGLDTKRLQTDMQTPTIQATIERNWALARELGINGTPGFIIGTELIPGALDLQDLKQFITKVRLERRD